MESISSLYIHIPFCISKCRYCDFFSVPCSGISDDYVNALCNEIQYRIEQYHIDHLKTVYIGGGTPSLLSYTQLQVLIGAIKKNVSLDSAEITIELNPDDITEELLTNLYSLGINRISCGIQSMNDNALKYAGRRADRETNVMALNILKKWKGTLSLDLICGLPQESKESFLEGLKEVIDAGPDHISLYSLTIEEETPFGQALESGALDYDFDESDNLWLKGKSLLVNNGYFQYEVSNFCRKGFECSHNLSYWNHSNYLGCGSGGTGTVYNDDGSGFRWTNTTDIKKYVEFWNKPGSNNIPQIMENVSVEDSCFEFFMMGMRKIAGINTWDFERKFQKKVPEKFIELAYKWAEKKLCLITETSRGLNITLGEKGILFLNKFLESLI